MTNIKNLKEELVQDFTNTLLEIKDVSNENELKEEYKNLMVDFRETYHDILDGVIKKEIKVEPKKSDNVNPKWEEQILVVPRAKLFDGEFKDELAFQGVLSDQEMVERLVGRIGDNLKVMRRGGGQNDKAPKSRNAEKNEKFKQPIPYVLIKRGNEVFAYERLEQGGETKLHGKISIGAGGHMNEFEGTFTEILAENTKRELEEELFISTENYDIEYIGLINDDEDEVGLHHIGILAVINLPEGETVFVRETDQLKGSWMTIPQLKEVYDRLESWSKFSVDVLDEQLKKEATELFNTLDLKTNIKE